MADSRSGADPGLPISAVSALLGVPAATLRTWENRYRLFLTDRTAGGHRRYHERDVLVLGRMRDEVARGRDPATAAILARADVAGPAYGQRSLTSFVAAAGDGSRVRLDEILDRYRQEHGVDAAICGLVLPGMRQIGISRQDGACTLAGETAATQSVRTWLARLRTEATPDTRIALTVLASAPAERHTIGVEAVATLLARRGRPVHVVGAHRDVGRAAATAHRLRAGVVVVVAQVSTSRRPAVAALSAAATCPVRLFFAGNAFLRPGARRGVPGDYLGEDLLVAVDTLSAAAPVEG